MVLRKLPKLKDLAKNLKKYLTKYKELIDIIIFGSYVTGKDFPKDIDLCLILKKENLDLITNLRTELEKDINYKTHTEFIYLKDFYSNPLWRSLEREGFSIKKNKFLKDILSLNPHIIYKYQLLNLKKWEKVRVAQVINKMIKEYKGEKLGLGSIIVPREHSSYFVEFFNRWKIKYEVKWVDVLE